MDKFYSLVFPRAKWNVKGNGSTLGEVIQAMSRVPISERKNYFDICVSYIQTLWDTNLPGRFIPQYVPSEIVIGFLREFKAQQSDALNVILGMEIEFTVILQSGVMDWMFTLLLRSNSSVEYNNFIRFATYVTAHPLFTFPSVTAPLEHCARLANTTDESFFQVACNLWSTESDENVLQRTLFRLLEVAQEASYFKRVLLACARKHPRLFLTADVAYYFTDYVEHHLDILVCLDVIDAQYLFNADYSATHRLIGIYASGIINGFGNSMLEFFARLPSTPSFLRNLANDLTFLHCINISLRHKAYYDVKTNTLFEGTAFTRYHEYAMLTNAVMIFYELAPYFTMDTKLSMTFRDCVNVFVCIVQDTNLLSRKTMIRELSEYRNPVASILGLLPTLVGPGYTHGMLIMFNEGYARW